MHLPAFCLAFLCWAFQQPNEPWTVSAGQGSVSVEVVERVRQATGEAVRELVPRFGGMQPRPFRVVVHGSGADLPEGLRGGHHPGSPGLAVLGGQEIHLLLRELRDQDRGDAVRTVVTHEVVHLLLHQLAGEWGAGVPRWFHEGMAQTLAGDGYLGAREQDIVWRASTRRLLWFSDLIEDFPHHPLELQLAYAQSYSYVAWLVGQFGLEAMLDVVRAMGPETTFAQGLVRVTGLPTVVLQDRWRDYLVHGSGAGSRAMLDLCFPLSMVLALPLLALALIRRLRSDDRARDRMRRQEIVENATPPGEDPPGGTG